MLAPVHTGSPVECMRKKKSQLHMNACNLPGCALVPHVHEHAGGMPGMGVGPGRQLSGARCCNRGASSCCACCALVCVCVGESSLPRGLRVSPRAVYTCMRACKRPSLILIRARTFVLANDFICTCLQEHVNRLRKGGVELLITMDPAPGTEVTPILAFPTFYFLLLPFVVV